MEFSRKEGLWGLGQDLCQRHWFHTWNWAQDSCMLQHTRILEAGDIPAGQGSVRPLCENHGHRQEGDTYAWCLPPERRIHVGICAGGWKVSAASRTMHWLLCSKMSLLLQGWPCLPRSNLLRSGGRFRLQVLRSSGTDCTEVLIRAETEGHNLSHCICSEERSALVTFGEAPLTSRVGGHYVLWAREGHRAPAHFSDAYIHAYIYT